jgi:hypothetical protein
MGRNELSLQLREQLEQAQHHYKIQYNHKRWELQFAMGDWVWLCLLHQPMASLNIKCRGKLQPKFFGPFKILSCVGEAADKLELPA